MKAPDFLIHVKEFHETFNQPVLYAPEIPGVDRCKLRVSLLEEELKELKQAIENNDLVEVADALCDLQYVLGGAILEFGLAGKFEELFNEVQRSNMSKACSTEEEAKSTAEYYQIQENTQCVIRRKDNKFLVYRESDNKVLKSVNYSKADLKSKLH